MVHRRDNEKVGEVKSPENQPQFSQMMGQCWVGKTKPRQRRLMMPSDQRNLIMAKAMSLIFSLFDITSAQEVPFGIPQYV